MQAAVILFHIMHCWQHQQHGHQMSTFNHHGSVSECTGDRIITQKVESGAARKRDIIMPITSADSSVQDTVGPGNLWRNSVLMITAILFCFLPRVSVLFVFTFLIAGPQHILIRHFLFNSNCSYPLPITAPSNNTSLLQKHVIIKNAENLLNGPRVRSKDIYAVVRVF